MTRRRISRLGADRQEDAYGELISRLWNWSRYAQSDPDKPKVALSAIYSEWSPYGSGRDEGWGEPDAAPSTDWCDEDDGERMDVWIRQLALNHRCVLIRRFVQYHRVGWGEVQRAVVALADLMNANWETVERLR